MLRWQLIGDKVIYGRSAKMYRDPFVPLETTKANVQGVELDHLAYLYQGSELFTYRILDTNFIAYMEERGDLDAIGVLDIPTSADEEATIL